MRIGYFGGTFDPPHRGHLAVALAAADAFALDRVLLAPTGRQPLKEAALTTDYADRLAMTKLLCAADPRLQLSEVDRPREDESPNYTVDALSRLRELQPEDALFCIVGADSFLSLRHWREPERVLAMAEWIVVSRPEFDLSDLSALQLTPEQAARVHLLTTVNNDTSSTGIRERLRVGVSPGDRLTPEVLLYIARLRLYHPDRQTPGVV